MLCRLYQWRIEHELDDGRKIESRRLQTHLDRCGRCREHLRHLTAAGQVLSSSPPVVLSELSCRRLTANAVEYVERGVFAENLSHESQQGILYAKRFAATAAAVFLAAAGLLMFNMKQNSSLNEAASTLALGTKAIQTPLPAVAEWSEMPIRMELEKLIAGAQNAIGFLWNCTPGHFEQTKDIAEPNAVSQPDK